MVSLEISTKKGQLTPILYYLLQKIQEEATFPNSTFIGLVLIWEQMMVLQKIKLQTNIPRGYRCKVFTKILQIEFLAFNS